MNTHSDRYEIFCVAPPGLEPYLQQEALENGFHNPKRVPGGVILSGNWSYVWRANLALRGASRILVRIASFPVTQFSQLEKQARSIAWNAYLKQGQSVRIDVTSKGSKLYHERAIAERIGNVLAQQISADIDQNTKQRIMVRVEKNMCVISLDTTGDLLHRRGHKPRINKAPMRENLAALFLRACEFDGTEPVIDPMCGSGTFVLEAAEVASGMIPGRTRSFAFETFATFDAEKYAALKEKLTANTTSANAHYFGYDRDEGAVEMASKNAEAAGVAKNCIFQHQAISDLKPSTSEKGLVIINPPYGERIGDNGALKPLYQSIGKVLKHRFDGWRVGIITPDPKLAFATGLNYTFESPRIDHGGIGVKLWYSATEAD